MAVCRRHAARPLAAAVLLQVALLGGVSCHGQRSPRTMQGTMPPVPSPRDELEGNKEGRLDESPRPANATDVFYPGLGGYPCFRIPSLVEAPGGDGLLALAEGRRGGCGDFAGPHDLLSRRWRRGDAGWGPLTTVASVDVPPFESGDALWNPCAVVDGRSGDYVVLFNRAPAALNNPQALMSDPYARETFVTRSHDGGKSWLVASNITAQTQSREWIGNSLAPGRGIELAGGVAEAGTLVMPGYHGVLGDAKQEG